MDIQGYYDAIKSAHFAKNIQTVKTDTNTNGVETEVIDIIRDYPWSGRILKNSMGSGESFFGGNVQLGSNTAVAGHSISHNFPYCYCVEREQLISSSIMNMLNSFFAKEDLVENSLNSLNIVAQATGLSDTVEKLTAEVKSFGNTLWNHLKTAIGEEKFNQATNKINSFGEYVSTALSNQNLADSKLLHPYRFLYSTAQTGKFFVFPILTETDLFGLTSHWGEDQDGDNQSLLLNATIGTLSNIGNELGKEVTMLNNVLSLFGNGRSHRAYHIDQGKFYNYPTEGDELTVSFPLYNTSARGAWEQNFRFLFLFAARNLPTKMSISEYKVPLLYDVIIPGHKRLPISYVSSFGVKPLGIIRTMTCDSILKNISGSWNVPIPEAWEVSIKFKSLIPPSLNLMLAAMSDDKIKIKTKEKTESNGQ